MTVFALDPRIAAGTLAVAERPLCLVRLMNDRRYPWLLVIPRRPDVTELFHLPPPERHALIDFAADLAAGMTRRFAADKMNVGALGNRVPQFHLHVIVRRVGDPAWPDAVWNGTAAISYADAERDAMLADMRALLPG